MDLVVFHGGPFAHVDLGFHDVLHLFGIGERTMGEKAHPGPFADLESGDDSLHPFLR
jgi:hypothetical protein